MIGLSTPALPGQTGLRQDVATRDAQTVSCTYKTVNRVRDDIKTPIRSGPHDRDDPAGREKQLTLEQFLRIGESRYGWDREPRPTCSKARRSCPKMVDELLKLARRRRR